MEKRLILSFKRKAKPIAGSMNGLRDSTVVESDPEWSAADQLELPFETARQARDYGKGSVTTINRLILRGLGVRGNVFGLESFFRDNGGKKYRGAWSFFEDPSDHILEELS